MADYEFTTTWKMQAPLRRVWEEIGRPQEWPLWWRGLQSVEKLEPGDENGVGGRWRYIWKGALPYRLTVDIAITRAEPPTLLEGAVSGDLQGTGRWRLSGNDVETVVRFDWQVSSPRPWMRFVAPMTRPLFKWNHDQLMERGRQGLTERIAARSVAIEKTPPA